MSSTDTILFSAEIQRAPSPPPHAVSNNSNAGAKLLINSLSLASLRDNRANMRERTNRYCSRGTPASLHKYKSRLQKQIDGAEIRQVYQQLMDGSLVPTQLYQR